MLDTECTPESLEDLQAGLFSLLDSYVEEPCHGIAGLIAGQLERLLLHPVIDLFPELRRNYARRLNTWRIRAGFAASGLDSLRPALH